MSVVRIPKLFCAVLLGAALAMASTAALAQKRQFSFAYDQPKNSGYGVGAEMFSKKLRELSKGTLSINQYPRRPARHRSADHAEGANRRHRLRDAVDRQRLDRATRIRRVLDPLHLPQ